MTLIFENFWMTPIASFFVIFVNCEEGFMLTLRRTKKNILNDKKKKKNRSSWRSCELGPLWSCFDRKRTPVHLISTSIPLCFGIAQWTHLGLLLLLSPQEGFLQWLTAFCIFYFRYLISHLNKREKSEKKVSASIICKDFPA